MNSSLEHQKTRFEYIGISLAIALVTLTIYLALRNRYIRQPQSLPIEASIIVGDKPLRLEVAKTEQQQAYGLKYRSNLAEDWGMLFQLPRPQKVAIWMQDVRFPLDIIFIRGDRIISIVANAPPCPDWSCPLYTSDLAIDQVLEVNAGLAIQAKLQVGDLLPVNSQK
jgi:uncharacterized membrane protein (UPF0127 family)